MGDMFDDQVKKSTKAWQSYVLRSRKGQQSACPQCGNQGMVTNPKNGGMMPCPNAAHKAGRLRR